ncbi:23S rRNA (pseudouridine(1915)-N(3))-methyltransferase RlmH [Usitatibacter palustris]|uniref:Ribosomal RNA large subunit methyltransferase H n=1 Tax=Usitatibacter palustris TaxID=2732487 RepID=A0A6M4H205_9PROT|nr:23S rRNA (pseudouridine(1915)-N(3))-methyltransferase RlmH [Usitatibacter palustris]QJR13375.1 Ribosomal RNA large subunit methyltransferase H [Usitatibacter palustris]
MRLAIIAVGHKMPGWIQEGFNEYTRRMPPELRVELTELKPDDRGSGKTVEKAKALEGERILAAVPDGATLIALDERGRSVTTQGLSVMLSEWMRDGTAPAFVIGGADGLSEAVKERANKLISLSVMTLPHALARVLLAEQLYRAWSILAKHPYHRE